MLSMMLVFFFSTVFRPHPLRRRRGRGKQRAKCARRRRGRALFFRILIFQTHSTDADACAPPQEDATQKNSVPLHM
jgi:hypothetical protein